MDGGNSEKQSIESSSKPASKPNKMTFEGFPGNHLNSPPSSDKYFCSDFVGTDENSPKKITCKFYHGMFGCPEGFKCPDQHGIFGLNTWRVAAGEAVLRVAPDREPATTSRKRKAGEFDNNCRCHPSGSKHH